MNYMRSMTSLGLMLLATGCALGPDYKRPAVELPPAYRADAMTAGGQSLGELPWWEVFQDDALRELITIALAENKDLQVATARIAEARATWGIAKADLFPQVNGGANASRTRLSELTAPSTLKAGSVPLSIPSPTGSGPGISTRLPIVTEGKPDLYANLYQAGFDLAYEVDLWGRIRRGSEAARNDLLATEEARRTIISTLVADVARAYFDLREFDAELQIAERTLKSRRESERLIRLRRDGGIATGLDLRRAEGETASTAAAIPAIEQAIGRQENLINILLGRNPGDVLRGRALELQPVAPTVPAGLPAEVLDRRPDILLAEAQLAAATARIGEAKALFFPRISLTGMLGLESPELSEWLEHKAHTWQIAGGLAQPIFQGGRIWFNYKAVQARREQLLINYAAAIQQSLREVSDALILRAKSTERRIEQEKLVTALLDAVKLADMRYKGGKSSYLEVLDAERELFSAELDLAQSRRDELVAVVLLYKALGGGWAQQIEGGAADALAKPADAGREVSMQD